MAIDTKKALVAATKRTIKNRQEAKKTGVYEEDAEVERRQMHNLARTLRKSGITKKMK